MKKYYDHDLWHQHKLRSIHKDPFKYKAAQAVFVMDALSYENTPGPCDLLDLGCGIGDISLAFAEQGYKVTGLEYSGVAHKESLALAKKAKLPVNFMKGNVLEADNLPPGCWGFVTAVNLLHCLVTDNDRKKFFAVLKKLLKPDGVFYLSSMCGIPGAEIVKQTKVDKTTRIGSNGTRIHLEAETILSELSANGFEVLEHRTFTYSNDREHGFETRDLSVIGKVTCPYYSASYRKLVGNIMEIVCVKQYN